MERGAKSYIWVTAAVTMIFVAPLLARSERVAVTDRPYDTEAFAALIAQNSAGDTVGKARVDYRSDVTILSNQGAFAKLVGNVAFHHNGVVSRLIVWIYDKFHAKLFGHFPTSIIGRFRVGRGSD